LSGLDADRDAVQGDRAVQHPLVPSVVEIGRRVVEGVVDVDHGPPTQHPCRIDEGARGKRAGVRGRAVARDAGDERGRVERTGRGAHDEVEAAGHAKALQRGGHPGRDDPTHAAALDHERDAMGIAARARLRAARGSRTQQL
jgi:hypothetical protein